MGGWIDSHPKGCGFLFAGFSGSAESGPKPFQSISEQPKYCTYLPTEVIWITYQVTACKCLQVRWFPTCHGHVAKYILIPSRMLFGPFMSSNRVCDKCHGLIDAHLQPSAATGGFYEVGCQKGALSMAGTITSSPTSGIHNWQRLDLNLPQLPTGSPLRAYPSGCVPTPRQARPSTCCGLAARA
jgi:hypothetical protein